MRETNARTCITSRGDRGFVINGRRKAGALVALLLIAFAAVALHVSLSVPAALADDAAGSSLASGTIDAVGVETLETDETVESDIGLSLSPKRSAKAPVRAGNAATRVIESAHLTEFTVSADGTTPASVVDVGQDLYVMLRWEVDDLSEIQNAGDYIAIELPSELSFAALQGSYKLNDERAGAYAGATIADFSVLQGRPSGGRFCVTFTAEGVDYLKSLEGNVLAGAFETSGYGQIVFSGASFTNASSSGKALTASLNGETMQSNPIEVHSEPYHLHSIAITAVSFNKITATGARINGAVKCIYPQEPFGITLRTDLLRLADVYRPHDISPGDYFTVMLPEQLIYSPLDEVVEVDGNTIRRTVCKVDDRFELIIEFVDVVDPRIKSIAIYSELTAELGMSGPFEQDCELNLTFMLPRCSISGSGAYYDKHRPEQWTDCMPVSALKDSTFDPSRYYYRADGIFLGGYDYSTGSYIRCNVLDRYYYGRAQLSVLANHADDLNPDPFANQLRLDWTPDANYIVTYCAEPTKDYPSRQSSQSMGMSYRKRPLVQGGRATELYLGESLSLSDSQVAALDRLLSTSYPYVSLDEMKSNLGFSGDDRFFTEELAAVVVQIAVWRTVANDYSYAPSIGNAAKNQYASQVIDALLAYEGTGAQGRGFVGEPTVAFSDDEAHVHGQITVRNAYDLTRITGTVKALSSGPEAELEFAADGSFTATLPGVSPDDAIQVDVVYPEYRNVETAYYICDNESRQNQIGADVEVVGGGTYTWKRNADYVDVAVAKEWRDAAGKAIIDVTKPVRVGLFQNGELVREVKLTSNNGYAHTWTLLPLKNDDGETYSYEVQELQGAEGFSLIDTQVAFDEEAGKYTFKLVNRKNLTFTVYKRWGDGSNAEPSVNMKLYRETATTEPELVEIITLSPDNQWAYTVNDLECSTVVDGDKVDWKYYVEEDVPDGWVASYGNVTRLDGGYIQRVTNNRAVVLPESGGMGVIPFAVVGLALMAAAGTLIVRRRHN